MKPLADRIFDLIPRTPHGLSLQAAKQAARQDTAHVRAAFDALHDTQRAIIVKRGRGGALYLVHRDTKVLACVVCHTEFTRKPQSKRLTCSRPCHAAYGWRDPVKAEARRKALSAAQSTPKALARTAATNKRRWAKPEEHEKLAEQSRNRWKDPDFRAVVSAKIRVNHQAPEMRAFYSKKRKEDWARPEYAAMVKAKSAASLREQARRARSSQMMKDRWADPAIRAKFIRANAARNTPELRAKNAARLKAIWSDPVKAAEMRAKQRATIDTPEYRNAVSARMKAAHKNKAFRKKYLAGLKKGRKTQKRRAGRNVPQGTFESALA